MQTLQTSLDSMAVLLLLLLACLLHAVCRSLTSQMAPENCGALISLNADPVMLSCGMSVDPHEAVGPGNQLQVRQQTWLEPLNRPMAF